MQVYSRIIDDILNYFHEQGINIVTIQPEFTVTQISQNESKESLSPVGASRESPCLVKCRLQECELKHCCIQNHLSDPHVHSDTVHTAKQQKSSESCNLEKVISVQNCDETELKEVVMNLNDLAGQKSTHSLINSEPPHQKACKKTSTVSLILPSDHHMGRNNKHFCNSSHSRVNEEAALNKTHFYSESTLDNIDSTNKQEIIIENKLSDQLEKTDNHEMENLYNRCQQSDE